MFESLPKDWAKVLENELKLPYIKKLDEKINLEYEQNTVFPTKDNILKAFSLCPFSKIKVVILGQDPYHGINQAEGLSFSVKEGIPLPPSLKNIYKELVTDIGKNIRTSGSLEDWAKQGVLLLNTTLTVKEGKPGSHQKLGWEEFTDSVISLISKEKGNVVFILWGKPAEVKTKLIDEEKHLILKAPHPSPLSAYRGFFGSKPFSKTNQYLKEHGLEEINW